MSFQIEVKTGDAGTVIMRGCADGTVEFCKWGETNHKETGSVRAQLVPYKFYANIEQAFNRILSMRVSSYEADNIKDLVQGIRAIRADIHKEMGGLI